MNSNFYKEPKILMERQDFDEQQNTPRRTASVRRPRPQRRPEVSADTKGKVSALFAEQDSEEAKFAIPEVELEAKRKPEPETAQAEAKEVPENLGPVMAEAEATEADIDDLEIEEIDIEETETAKPVKEKKKNSTRKLILTIIIIIAACGLLFSGYKLYSILHGYKEGENAYKEVEEYIKPAPTPEHPEAFSVDVAELKKLNPDAQGYIYCEDVLSYPIVQCADNDYYLTHLFNGEWNSCGCLFIDCNIPDGLEAKNCIIYGHNMNDGSMFASLYKYDDEEFYKTHKEFDVFTEGHHYIYKVFSLFVTPVDGFVYTTDFFSDEDYVNFLNVAAGCSPYETEYGELTADRKVITMSTCLGNDDEAHRFIVMLIRDREVTE
ncbi:MAG: class B sortase [Lachnospiraceae bacterium]|nr:class B sortase [Lachnospiraceae bacterium]